MLYELNVIQWIWLPFSSPLFSYFYFIALTRAPLEIIYGAHFPVHLGRIYKLRIFDKNNYILYIGILKWHTLFPHLGDFFSYYALTL